MIPRFTDHAANERTYLAWVRTAIAIIAFGFLIERFDVFLASIAHAAAHPAAAPHLHASEWAGLLLIVLGTMIILFATVRFLHYRKLIASEQPAAYGSTLSEQLLAGILTCLGLFLTVYVWHQLLTMG